MTNNTSTKIIKFYDLKVNETYTVVGVKIRNLRGDFQYILQVKKIAEDNIIGVHSSFELNEYIMHQDIEKRGKGFNFTTRRRSKRLLYAEIHDDDDDCLEISDYYETGYTNDDCLEISDYKTGYTDDGFTILIE